jgi:hypothetical protein
MAGALVLAVPLLSSCGFGKATDRVYTPAAGVNNRDGEVKVLSAVVVARQANSGTFIATMSNDNSTEDNSLESIASADETDLQFDDIDPAVEIAPRGYVNLADDEQGVDVRGEFAGGDFLHVTLTFSSGETTTMKIPVVYACDEWADLDKSLESTPSASPSADVPEPGDEYDCASVLYDEHSGDDTEPVV